MGQRTRPARSPGCAAARVCLHPARSEVVGPRGPDPSDTGAVRCAAVLVAVGACFHPAPPEGAPCANLTDCPSPLVCSNGSCVRTPDDAFEPMDAPIDIAIDADLSCSCQGSTLSCAGT